jgi:hypothetical protein
MHACILHIHGEQGVTAHRLYQPSVFYLLSIVVTCLPVTHHLPIIYYVFITYPINHLYLSIISHLPTYRLPTYHLSLIYLPTYLSTYHLSIYLSSIYPSIYLSLIYLSIHLSIHLAIIRHPSVHCAGAVGRRGVLTEPVLAGPGVRSSLGR